MSTYAVLGASGWIGGSVFEVLAQQDRGKIHCFVRSATKLKSKAAEICSLPNVKIFEGDISNLDVLTECIRDTKAIFLCVAIGSNKPGVRIAQTQVEAVVAVLEKLRLGDDHIPMPTLVLLSSAGAENHPKLNSNVPWLFRAIFFAANHHVYIDLIKAEEFLRTKDWLNIVYFKPGGISEDVQRGHILSEERQQTFISLLDVAAGMIECADDGERLNGKCISVLSNSQAKIGWSSLGVVGRGLLIYLMPSLYSWLF